MGGEPSNAAGGARETTHPPLLLFPRGQKRVRASRLDPGPNTWKKNLGSSAPRVWPDVQGHRTGAFNECTTWSTRFHLTTSLTKGRGIWDTSADGNCLRPELNLWGSGSWCHINAGRENTTASNQRNDIQLGKYGWEQTETVNRRMESMDWTDYHSNDRK